MIFRPHEPTQPVRRRKLHNDWLRLMSGRLLTATRALSQPTVIYRLLYLLIVKVRQQLSQHVNIGVLSCDGLGLRNNRRHLLYKLNLSLQIFNIIWFQMMQQKLHITYSRFAQQMLQVFLRIFS